MKSSSHFNFYNETIYYLLTTFSFQQLEDKLKEQKIKETTIPDNYIDRIRKKEQVLKRLSYCFPSYKKASEVIRIAILQPTQLIDYDILVFTQKTQENQLN